MGERFLVDTNIIIYHIASKIPSSHKERIRAIFRSSFYISTITKIELLGWKTDNQEELARIEQFLAPARIFYMEEAIESKAIEIKRHRKIPIPDAIIGATALVHDLTLVTRNESDFKRVAGLNCYNPFE